MDLRSDLKQTLRFEMFQFIFVFSTLFVCDIFCQVVEVVEKSPKLINGKSPFWDQLTQSLFYVDEFSENTTIFRYDFNKDIVYSANIINETSASSIIPVQFRENHFVVGLDRGAKIIQWDGRSRSAKVIRTLFDIEKTFRTQTNHMNECKADPMGRFYGGTIKADICNPDSPANSSLYRYSKKDGLVRLLDNLRVANGLAWNRKTNKFYYVDSCDFYVGEYDWNPNNGDISNERIAYNYNENIEMFPSGVPDGITIDNKGNLYVTNFIGSSVYKINPSNSTLLSKIEMPTQMITDCAFGGPNLDILFVTTGSIPLNVTSGGTTDMQITPSGGKLLTIKGLNAKGLPGRKVNIEF